MELMNPYSGQSFFGFFLTLIVRCWGFLTGKLDVKDIASDEIQIIVLTGVALSAALVGSFLVLRRMTMLANSISHTILLGIVVAFVLTQDFHHGINIQVMLVAALSTAMLTAFLTEFLTKTVRLQEDASTGIVFTTFFALGIVLITVLSRNAHIGAEIVMGNVDALHIDDCRLVLIVLGINVTLMFLFFKEYKITTFDAGLSNSLGISSSFYNYLLMAQVSVTVIAAFRAVGVLMVLSFLTGPPLIARLLTHSLKRMVLLAMLIGVFASWIGVAISRHLLSIHGIAISTAGVVVCTIIGLFVLSVVFRSKRS